VGDLPDRERFTAQFAAERANVLKGIKTIQAAVGIGTVRELTADEADGRIDGINETTQNILHIHGKSCAK
jgi:hypothetical protein